MPEWVHRAPRLSGTVETARTEAARHEIQSETFFRGRPLEAPVGALSYSPDTDGDLATFEDSAKCRKLVDQYREGIVAFKAMVRAGSGQAENLDTFLKRIQEGRTGYYSTQISLLYGEGKRSFDLLAAHIRNTALPEEKRRTTASNVADGLAVCSDGTLSNLIIETGALRGAGGLHNYARLTLDTLLSEAIRKFVQDRHGNEKNYVGNEIDYANGYRNRLADDYGLAPRPDNMVPPQVGADDNLEKCNA